jgi:hypothetical protein
VINNNQTAKDRGHKSKVDSADTSLMASYPEHNNPLGLKGAQTGISLPSNYNQKDVKNMRYRSKYRDSTKDRNRGKRPK